MRLHKAVLIILYGGGLMVVAAVLTKGLHYYTLPLSQRPHSPLHPLLKPSGLWGHGLGIVGSSMMLLLFLYSMRKRCLCGLSFGKLRSWLNIHIFLGIMGPILVTLHTSFKFGGLVSVSYFSMVAVMLSGFVGRYLYVQIPRALSGDELTAKEMSEHNERMTRVLVEQYHIKPEQLRRLQGQAVTKMRRGGGGLAVLAAILKDDLTRPFRVRAFKRRLRREQLDLPQEKVAHLVWVAKQQSLLMRKMALLSAIKPLFHYWHVAHKPFAYVMIIIMFLHVTVTILFGYRWIF
ncbi:MAG: hypothetical protein D6743_14960 [Calditrichaeota bacterium]|nr:MAG: hypothetical protein D6743_14960 [Calditrichota bacterium]